jgi:hypothetical protein
MAVTAKGYNCFFTCHQGANFCSLVEKTPTGPLCSLMFLKKHGDFSTAMQTFTRGYAIKINVSWAIIHHYPLLTMINHYSP